MARASQPGVRRISSSSKTTNISPSARPAPESLVSVGHVGQDHAAAALDRNDRWLRTPPMRQVPMVCDHPEGSFPVPSACSQFPHIRQRQHPGIQDMAQIPIRLPLLPDVDQAHRSPGRDALNRSWGQDRIQSEHALCIESHPDSIIRENDVSISALPTILTLPMRMARIEGIPVRTEKPEPGLSAHATSSSKDLQRRTCQRSGYGSLTTLDLHSPGKDDNAVRSAPYSGSGRRTRGKVWRRNADQRGRASQSSL